MHSIILKLNLIIGVNKIKCTNSNLLGNLK
jgi:hypothetical protein